MKNKTVKLIGSFLVMSLFVAFMVLSTTTVLASCEYGEECTYDRRFKITKEVRIEGDNTWRDKVTGVKKGQIVDFRITVKNKSDDEADKANDMETKDILPDEMTKVGGAGLTENWDKFYPGDTKTFIITAKVKDSEYNRAIKFEKCVVNKVELRWKGDFQGSDTATVCYGNVEPSELPKTGALSTLALTGVALLALGLVARKFAER